MKKHFILLQSLLVVTLSSGLQTSSLLLQCSGHVQSKNGVDLVEVGIF